MDPTRPYDPTDAAQEAVVSGVEQRMDEVTPDGRTPRFQREKVYGFTAIACDSVLGSVPAAVVAPLAADVADGLGQLRPFTAVLGSRVDVGADFLRVVSVQLAGWVVAVSSSAPPEDPAYALSMNPHARRSVFAPGVFHVPAGGGHRLDLFPASTGEGADVVHVLRRQRPEAVAAASPTLYDAVLWAGAGAVLEAERYTERAESAYARAATVIAAMSPQ